MGLLLRAVDVAGPTRWRWLLTDAARACRWPITKSTSRARRPRWRGSPPRSGTCGPTPPPTGRSRTGPRSSPTRARGPGRRCSARRWARRSRPPHRPAQVSVQVVAPPPTDKVLLWPLELAHVAGKPLAARGDVTFVRHHRAQGLGRQARDPFPSPDRTPTGRAAPAGAGAGRAGRCGCSPCSPSRRRRPSSRCAANGTPCPG